MCLFIFRLVIRTYRTTPPPPTVLLEIAFLALILFIVLDWSIYIPGQKGGSSFALITSSTMVTTQQVVLSSLVGLAAWQSGSSSTVAASTTAGNDTITNDTYFYGQSPPIYPSREFAFGKGLGVFVTLEEFGYRANG